MSRRKPVEIYWIKVLLWDSNEFDFGQNSKAQRNHYLKIGHFWDSPVYESLNAYEGELINRLLLLSSRSKRSTHEVTPKALRRYNKGTTKALRRNMQGIADKQLIEFKELSFCTIEKSIEEKSIEERKPNSRELKQPDLVETKQPPTIPLTVIVEKPTPKKKPKPKYDLEAAYKLYPRKEGKSKGMAKLSREIASSQEYEQLVTSIKNYSETVKNKDREFIKMFSSFATDWRDYIEVLDTGSILQNRRIELSRKLAAEDEIHLAKHREKKRLKEIERNKQRLFND